MLSDPLDHLADLNRPGALRVDRKLVSIGSDVEIAGRVHEDLERAYGEVLHAEGNFWRYATSHWEAIPEYELRLAVHEYDGARFKTPAGEPSRVKLGKSRVDSVLNELAALMAKPSFFEKRLPQRELEEVREKDPDGRIVYHHRTVDTLGKMLRAGTITPEMHDAAKDFQTAFIVASLDPLRALPILRVPGTGRDPDLNDRQLHARHRVHKTLQALGGISSPAGSCVWHVVGLQRSVREWAIRQGWCGRPVRQEQAQGILIAALGMLAGHLGYSEAKRAS